MRISYDHRSVPSNRSYLEIRDALVTYWHDSRRSSASLNESQRLRVVPERSAVSGKAGVETSSLPTPARGMGALRAILERDASAWGLLFFPRTSLLEERQHRSHVDRDRTLRTLVCYFRPDPSTSSGNRREQPATCSGYMQVRCTGTASDFSRPT